MLFWAQSVVELGPEPLCIMNFFELPSLNQAVMRTLAPSGVAVMLSMLPESILQRMLIVSRISVVVIPGMASDLLLALKSKVTETISRTPAAQASELRRNRFLLCLDIMLSNSLTASSLRYSSVSSLIVLSLSVIAVLDELFFEFLFSFGYRCFDS